MYPQKVYTLTAGEQTLDLSRKNLGPADVKLLSKWMQRPEVSAALTELNVLQNRIGDEAMQALQRVAPSSVQLIQ